MVAWLITQWISFPVNIIAISYGALCGWPSSALPFLQSEESPLNEGPISNEAASWIGSIICIGGLIGNFFFGWLASALGRKVGLNVSALFLLISLLTVPLSKSVVHLCISRFIGGFAGAGAFAIIPLFIAEIAEDR